MLGIDPDVQLKLSTTTPSQIQLDNHNLQLNVQMNFFFLLFPDTSALIIQLVFATDPETMVQNYSQPIS